MAVLSVAERHAEGGLRGSPGEEGPDASADPEAGERRLRPSPQTRPVGFQRHEEGAPGQPGKRSPRHLPPLTEPHGTDSGCQEVPGQHCAC